MFAVLEALGILTTVKPTPTGQILAGPNETVRFPRPQGSVRLSPTIPLGAPLFASVLDPGDLTPIAFDFSAWLGGNEIGQIVAITLSDAGAAAGVQIAEDDPREPLVSTDGQIVQIWLSVDAARQGDPVFVGPGLMVAITVHVRTNAETYQEIERTGVVVVRQS